MTANKTKNFKTLINKEIILLSKNVIQKNG